MIFPSRLAGMNGSANTLATTSSSSLDLGRPSPMYAIGSGVGYGQYGRSASSSSVNISSATANATALTSSSTPNHQHHNANGLGTETPLATGRHHPSSDLGSAGGSVGGGSGGVRSLRTQYPSNRSLSRAQQTPIKSGPPNSTHTPSQMSGGRSAQAQNRYHRQANPSLSSISGISDAGESQFALEEVA